jgi:hypothetical protein
MSSWLTARLGGRMRVSTVVLLVVFVALFWVDQTFRPEPPAPEAPVPAVVPPGFVPDPNYTWVPRTNVRRPKETIETTTTTPTTTTTTTTTSPTETTSPTDTTSPSSPTSTTPTPATTTVIDPDGEGLLPPVTVPALPPGPAPPPATPPAP